MRVGLISDIHANWHALREVLAALDAARVDLILCAGDLVCYGAHPNEVLALVRERGIPCALGNYDAAVAWDWPSASRRPSTPPTEPLKQAALDWAKRHVAREHHAFLRGLPWRLDYRLGGLRFILCHAGPDSLEDAFSPDQPDDLWRLNMRYTADVMVLGHTHQAYVYPTSHTLFINPGAVGRALDGDVRAAYAILDTATRRVSLERVDYDIEEAAQAIMTSGMPPVIAALVRRGARRIEEVVIS